MIKIVSLLACVCVVPLHSQERDDVVKRETISVHVVERGSMAIFGSASGSLTSLQPALAVVTFEKNQGKCEPGRSAKLVVADNARPLAGNVVRRVQGNSAGQCEVAFADALPKGAVVGSKVKALAVIDELKDVIFLGRPASATANSTATIYVLDEHTPFARRVNVRYGVRSGPLIQVLDGLAPGDQVIVTGISKLTNAQRVRIE
jgi:hypothetical protein